MGTPVAEAVVETDEATITVRTAEDADTTLSGFSEPDPDGNEEVPFHEKTVRLSEQHTLRTSVGDRDVILSVRDVEWRDDVDWG